MPTPKRKIKSNKPERRQKQPVDLGNVDEETPTPGQQSSKAGAGTGRARARRINERAPKVAGAKAKPHARSGVKMDKALAKPIKNRARDKR